MVLTTPGPERFVEGLWSAVAGGDPRGVALATENGGAEDRRVGGEAGDGVLADESFELGGRHEPVDPVAGAQRGEAIHGFIAGCSLWTIRTDA
jgi:hypothetical protein